tara:strand:+ start:1171 stop:1851 length:681 start_codon:yes stop_codon:yes gene_type:complete
MIRGSRVFALIPARGGSKKIKNKNLIKINSYPLIHYTLTSAIKSNFIDEIYVSSDSHQILKFCSKYKVKTHLRPSSISYDFSTGNEVVLDFINSCKILNDDYIIYLQPTSPLRKSLHINSAFNILSKDKRIKNVVSVKKINYSYEKLLYIKNSKINNLHSDKLITENRQSLNEAYLANGAIYIFTKKKFMYKKVIPIIGSFPYLMDNIASLDIDTYNDINKVKKYL